MAGKSGPRQGVAMIGGGRFAVGRGAFVIKIGISAVLLAWLASATDWRPAAERLADASPLWLAVGFLAKVATVPCVSERWRMLAGALAGRFAPLAILRVTLIGQFFGQALPGAVGTDAVRGWLTWRLGCPPSAVLTTLAADRFIALAGLGVAMTPGLPHLAAAAPAGVEWLVAAAWGVGAVGLAALVNLDRLPLPFFSRLPIRAALAATACDLRRALTWRLAAATLGWSVAAHLLAVGTAAAYARALGLSITPLDCLAVVPFAIAVVALPVSLAGWGVREGSMVAGFALFGVPTGEALLLSVMIGLTILLVALPGAVVWLIDRRPVPAPVGQDHKAASAPVE
jgi:glycosyltransferase 2 family protein